MLFSNYHRITGLITVLSGVLALACLMVGLRGVDFDGAAFSDPTQLLKYAHNATYVKWFALLDLFGYYILLIPAIFYLHRSLHSTHSWMSVFTFCGLSYTMIGAIGSAILAAVWSYLMQEYLLASGADKTMITWSFKTITVLVNTGLWNILETLLGGVWWMGIGFALRPIRKAFALYSIVLGVFTILDSWGEMLNMSMLSEIGLNVYLILSIGWAIWAGVLIFQRKLEEVI